jgi:hypothetical protein
MMREIESTLADRLEDAIDFDDAVDAIVEEFTGDVEAEGAPPECVP